MQIRKQTYKDFFQKRCSENMQQIFRRTPMPKCVFDKLLCNFIEITLRHGCSPVNLLHIFRTPTLGSLLEGLYMRFILVQNNDPVGNIDISAIFLKWRCLVNETKNIVEEPKKNKSAQLLLRVKRASRVTHPEVF